MTAAELELFETVQAMAEEVPRAVRYTVSPKYHSSPGTNYIAV